MSAQVKGTVVLAVSPVAVVGRVSPTGLNTTLEKDSGGADSQTFLVRGSTQGYPSRLWKDM